MKYEKSCGAVIWRETESGHEYLLVQNKKPGAKGHWGFPKGHIEDGETEEETARREIFEETGLTVGDFAKHFRIVTRYSPAPNVEKDVVYFLTKADGDVTVQECEIADYKWLSYKDAKETLTFDYLILDKAESFLAK